MKSIYSSENLVSAMEKPFIIDIKLKKNLKLRHVDHIPTPFTSFISSLLSFVPKYNRGFRQIHHLFHPKERSINNCILDGARKL